MIDRYLGGVDWDEAPPEMGLEESYGDILAQAGDILGRLRAVATSAEFEPGEAERLAVRLYVRAPALVNVVLNYKICVEHGLPLHPTVYYELAEARRYRVEHPITELESANRLFRASIELARAVYRLDENWERIFSAFRALLPQELLRFIYTSGPDRYTWRASEPAKLSALAAKLAASFAPDLIVAAAHGSIMPGLLLAEYLDVPLYFVRFSMFKRMDEAPIVSLGDEVWLSAWREGKALLYDEDVAKGTTLELFAKRLSPMFAQAHTACSIRHAGSLFKPDFAAKVWWD
ncbi:MAG: hypothetical protein M0Z80_09765 [Treponema sp.]|nr:hypothetical protein [Treponema sp.]